MHYISTPMSSKYHRSSPQSIFKSWYFPCEDISVELSHQVWWLRIESSRLNDDRHCSRAWLTHHCSFRCQIWFSPRWLAWVWHAPFIVCHHMSSSAPSPGAEQYSLHDGNIVLSKSQCSFYGCPTVICKTKKMLHYWLQIQWNCLDKIYFFLGNIFI